METAVKKYRTVVDCKAHDFAYIVRTDNVATYFREISAYPLLTPKEERKLLKIAKTGTPLEREKAKNRLVECNQRFVASVAKRWAKSANFLDIVNEGNLGLIEAVEKFDIAKDCHFITYAVWWIRKYISDFVAEKGGVVSKPNNTKVRRYVRKAKSAFINEYYREPSAEELMEYIKEHYGKNFRYKEDFIKYSISSIDYNPDDDNGVKEPSLTAYNNQTASNNITEKTDREDNKEIISKFLEFLNEREYYVVTNFYGIGTEAKSVDEIGVDMKRSRERVRQVLAASLVKMKQHAAEVVEANGNYNKEKTQYAW